MPVEKIDHALDTIKSNDIQNVLALRGDPPHGQDKFVVVSRAYNGLATPESYQSDLAYLKKPETKIINEQLGDINLKGPSVSTANHQLMEQNLISHLMGGPGGYVYRKAYVEFFYSAEKLNAVVEKCKAFASPTYMAVDKEGSSWISNVNETGMNAVT
ncbi:hypothetical protein LguiB_031922 [Lonicera macranthoides]